MTLSTVDVHGQFFRPDGVTPESGEVVFTLEDELRDTSTGEVIGPTQIVGSLDTNGEFTVQLVATDDADASPQGLRYRVHQRFSQGRTLLFRLEVPSANPTLEFGALVPIDDAADPTYSWVADGGTP